jgi:hypothetical protein
VIRRGFWVLLGAAAGIAGYRKAEQFARQPTRAARQTVRTARDAASAARETARFARDVRDGMDEYIARHPRSERPTLSGPRQLPGPRDDTERHGNGVG